MRIEEIEKAVQGKEFNVAEFKGWKVADPRKFISNHIAYLKGNSGKAAYLPYYNRLIEYLNTQNK